MAIDLALVSSIGEKVLLLVAGGFINRLFERRSRLFVFYGHIAAFRLQGQPSGTPPGIVHTHAIVLLNSGRLPAHNVRVHHHPLPPGTPMNISVFPDVAHTRQPLPGGGEEMLFPVIVPKQQVTISYLYFPPVTYSMINAQVSSDEGLARPLNVLPTPQMRPWVQRILWVLMLVGAVAVLYALVEALRWGGVRLNLL